MEATYKHAAAGKRRMQRTAEEGRREKRQLLQLVVSLGLFLLVFIGRGAFPALVDDWNTLLTSDADFAEAFERLAQDLSDDESLWSSLGRFAVAAFGGEVPELQPSAPADSVREPVEITLLGETKQHGIAYLWEERLEAYYIEPPADVAQPEPSVEPEPVVVTAVAQAYNAAGEKLPSNVSYENYALGLKETVVPVMGTVTSGFEYRTSPVSGKREFHLALDIAAAEGTAIAAFADGVVRYIGESDDFGLYLMIDHDNGVATFYAHCSKLLVRKGDVVTCGQTIALVGHTGNATGSHLHFTIEKDNIRLDPSYYVDPS